MNHTGPLSKEKNDLPLGWGALILMVGILYHIIGIGQPFLGNFAQHQTDYATVVQRWLETGIDPLNPVMRFIALSQQRVFLGDVPLTMTWVALICRFTGWGIEIVGRGLSAFFFFASLFPFYSILKRVFQDRAIAWWGLFFYAFSPLVIIYGQSFLLEIPALSFGIFAYAFFVRGYLDRSKQYLILSGLFFACMLGLRIYFAPVVLPAFLLLLFKYRSHILGRGDVFLFMLATMSLPLAWHIYAFYVGQAQGMESSLQDNVRVFMVTDPVLIRNFLDPKYYLPVFDTLLNKVVTPLGFALSLLGIVLTLSGKYKDQTRLILFAIVSFFVLYFIAPRKFIEFDYYHIPLVPFAAVLASLAIKNIFSLISRKRFGMIVIVSGTIFLAVRFSVAPLIIPHEDAENILNAAKEVREVVPQKSRILAAHDSTPFLYYCDRDGWVFRLPDQFKTGVRHFADKTGTAIERLERFRSQGAGYFVLADKSRISVNPALLEYLNNKYSLIQESSQTLIYSLQDSP